MQLTQQRGKASEVYPQCREPRTRVRADGGSGSDLGRYRSSRPAYCCSFLQAARRVPKSKKARLPASRVPCKERSNTPMQCPRSPCRVSWKGQQASHLGTSATLPCKLRYISVNPAPVHTQQSHLPPIQSKKQVSRSISIQHRRSANWARRAPSEQLSACQKAARLKYNLLHFYRRRGPTTAVAPGIGITGPVWHSRRLREAVPSAVSFPAHLRARRPGGWAIINRAYGARRSLAWLETLKP
jgi:hypothetical protein